MATAHDHHDISIVSVFFETHWTFDHGGVHRKLHESQKMSGNERIFVHIFLFIQPVPHGMVIIVEQPFIESLAYFINRNPIDFGIHEQLLHGQRLMYSAQPFQERRRMQYSIPMSFERLIDRGAAYGQLLEDRGNSDGIFEFLPRPVWKAIF
jgi:hypothetical protein